MPFYFSLSRYNLNLLVEMLPCMAQQRAELLRHQPLPWHLPSVPGWRGCYVAKSLSSPRPGQACGSASSEFGVIWMLVSLVLWLSWEKAAAARELAMHRASCQDRPHCRGYGRLLHTAVFQQITRIDLHRRQPCADRKED